MINEQLAILGGGNMGRALVGGLLRQGVRPERINVGEAVASAREALARDFGILATEDNARAAETAAVLVIAVKPQVVSSVLSALQPMLAKNRPLVVSVAAGIRSSDLERWCGSEVPVVRTIPNRPALVGAGATGLFASPHVSSEHRQRAERLMRAVGEVVWVRSEDELDIVTALSGSGPAYFFLMAELMARSAIELGLEPAAAQRLAVATLHGAGLLVHAGDGNLERLRAEVTSKGGTTEAAVRSLQAAELPSLIQSALRAAKERSRELAEQFGQTR